MSHQFPITAVIPSVKKSLTENNTVILQAPPGAGKSTVLPLALLDESWLGGKKILLLEPRRLAARAVSGRLAEQLQQSPGETVGYRIRFESKVGKTTRIEVVTEGILTRMLQQDNSLENTGLVIFDEFHERSLHADLALALCRESQQILRNDLRILIMSATLDGSSLSSLLGNAPVITSEGRQYPIEYRYSEFDDTLTIAQNTTRIIHRAMKEQDGDLLVFLPGSGDIHRCKDLLQQSDTECSIHTLYGDLPYTEQQAALLPDKSGNRKIVLSTSIAETSLTIEGIKIVVDSGYSRVPRYDVRSGLTHLETIRVTRDTADQRAGRAGRLGPGTCYRLWPERTHHHLIEHRKPEILEAELSNMVLELAQWGHSDPGRLNWITPPPEAALVQASLLLEQLGAMEDGRITAQGRKLLQFPTHPRIAHLLLHGKEHNNSAIAADVAALLEERDPLGRDAGADINLRLDVLRQSRNKERVNADKNALERVERVSRLWRSQLAVKVHENAPPHELAGALIAAAYPERIAKQEGEQGRYRLANGRIARLQPHDPLMHEEWISIAQLDGGTGEGKIFLAAPFDPTELIASTHGIENISWDERKGFIIARKEWKVGSLIIGFKPVQNPNEEKVSRILCDVIRKEGLDLFDYDEKTEQLCARVASLKIWHPEIELPDLNKEALVQSPEAWAAPFLQKIRKREEFRKLNLYEMLSALLTFPQHQYLQKFCPEKITVPTGSLIVLKYSSDGSSPVLSVRLQEVFGLTDTPTVNGGKNPVLLHLLSPGYRPVQVTSDLRSFWKNIYPEVRKELRVRYQKHSWPEDPWTAEPVRGAKKRK
ncbi:MAG: ATP-dependent helicase HrpB [Bacteroidia bacterium]|nr:ATP-dependent helicase HrpB [Bacteroidia bacterium]MBP6649236.1 ATP-dependent helicase HrpB [Bacteroidia bacterium]